jgi:site-specific recombinase XerC
MVRLCEDQATGPILDWCRRAGFSNVENIEPIHVAIRMLFSWLTEKGVLAMNPAREVKTERFSRTEGKTPGDRQRRPRNRRGLGSANDDPAWWTHPLLG